MPVPAVAVGRHFGIGDDVLGREQRRIHECTAGHGARLEEGNRNALFTAVDERTLRGIGDDTIR